MGSRKSYLKYIYNNKLLIIRNYKILLIEIINFKLGLKRYSI